MRLQDLPGKLTIGVYITGCPMRCKGCSASPWVHDPLYGEELTRDKFLDLLDRNEWADTVIFYGGDWYPDDLPIYLKIAHDLGFETCLYSGKELDKIDEKILRCLDYVKTGEWRGIPLDNRSTNQRFYKKVAGFQWLDITHIFLDNRNRHL
jgi:anaerobic ribonucleoside-triphosphate reductase activating protein